MAESKYTELFRFEADGMPEDTFHVLSFRGTEALSSLFSFDVELVSKNMSLDLEELLAGNAKLTIKRGGGFPDAVFAGRPAAARQTGSFGEYAYYSVTLRPAFWKFTPSLCAPPSGNSRSSCRARYSSTKPRRRRWTSSSPESAASR